MAPHPGYTTRMVETHHTQKLDAPSGTAVTLAEQILEKADRLKSWSRQPVNDPALISIVSKREDPAPGTHSVTWESDIDTIEITHTAHNRNGFASGAVLAAEFVKGKKGIFSMKEVLGL